MCPESIPSVTEKSVIFIKELSFPQTAPTDDAFFQPELGWSVLGPWAGPGLLAGWLAGSWIVGAEIGLLQCWSASSGRDTPLQNKEGGSARASLVAASFPLDGIFLLSVSDSVVDLERAICLG